MSFLIPHSFGVLLPVDFLLIYTIVWIYTQRQVNIITGQLRKRWETFTRLLMIIPGVVLLVIVFLIGLIWQTEPEARFMHATLVLSLWMPVTFMSFGVMASPRRQPVALILAFVVFILAGVPIIILTSIDGFHAVFDPIGYGIPLLISLGVVGFMYLVFIYVNKKIIRPPKSEIELKLKGNSSEYERQDHHD